MIGNILYGLLGLVAFNLIYILLSSVGLSGFAIAIVCSGVVGCLTHHVFRWRTQRVMRGNEALKITLIFALGVLVTCGVMLQFAGENMSAISARWTLLTVVTNQSIAFGLVMGWICRPYDSNA